MKHLRHLLCLLAVVAAVALVWYLPSLLQAASSPVPGLNAAERTLLRIWVTGSPGGAQSWLTEQLRAFEKQHPGVMTYLRTVSPDELTEEGALLPDILLYMPGDITAPQEYFIPLSGAVCARESLLRCGRWQGSQYGLPLCWGAWILGIDSALEPGSAITPAPTTLLGRPAATSAATATETPGFPLDAASQTECAIQSPGGAALLSLCTLLTADERPPLPDSFAQLSSAEVYSLFQSRKTASAVLTTGQITAFTSTVAAGKGFPFRVMSPSEIVTDQVWLASVTADAPDEAAALLGFLTAADAQQALTRQGLHTVRDDLTLYAAGVSAEVERAGRKTLSAINAYLDPQNVQSAAWQVFQGTLGFSEGLVPLL